MTTQSAINPFTQDAADAHANWKSAIAQLKAARETFNTGAVVRLKEILGNNDALQSKLKAAQLESTQAEADFKTAFEAAGFEKTAVVQKILNKKNDAIAICEELRAAIGHMQEEHKPIYLQADSEAQLYEIAHAAAFNAYCKMCAFAQLEKHGPPLVEAIALLKLVPTGNPIHESPIGPTFGISRSIDESVLNARMNRILGPLRTLAMDASVNTQDITDAVGLLNIAPVDGRNYITPAERHMLSHGHLPSALELKL